MEETYGAKYCSLHVRVSNKAAIHLYRERLRYDQNGVEAKYYADGEDAYDMRKQLEPKRCRQPVGHVHGPNCRH
jgi:N-alpha-acetyltransferase 10/11